MLVLARKLGESVVIPEYGITIKIVDIDRGKIRLGITAPKEVGIWRDELLLEKERAAAAAAAKTSTETKVQSV